MNPTPTDQPFQSRLLECSANVEKAVSQLYKFRPTLQALSKEIEHLGFHFSATQLLSPEGDIIETVFGVGVAKAWEGLAKHYLEQDEELRDIHADLIIRQNGISEIITGWDPRFDSWIYKTFDHQYMSRVFVPLMLVYDHSGHLVDSWHQNAIFEILEEVKNEESAQGLTGYCRSIRPHLEGMKIYLFGTVEAGIHTKEGSVSIDQAQALVRVVSDFALRIRRCQLPFILKSIATEAMRLSRSNSASIHYLYNPESGKYLYEASSGTFDPFWFKKNPPRIAGLGRMAIEEKAPKCIPNPLQKKSKMGLQEFNQKLYDAGIRSKAAIPIVLDDCKDDIDPRGTFSIPDGVLYIHFHETHEFSENELEAQTVLATQAQWAIRYTHVHENLRDTNLSFKTLHSVVDELTNLSENPNFLRHLAWNVVNLFAADVVSIYEYLEPENSFFTPPNIGGRIKFIDQMETAIYKNDAPVALLESGKTFHFSAQPRNDKVFNSRKRKEVENTRQSFIERENIHSATGLLLKTNGEIVGVMFVNFRRKFLWSESERECINFLASSAAIAIKKQRMLDTLTYIDKELVQTFDFQKILEIIVERVAHLMGFTVQARIFLVSADGQEMYLEAEYPYCRLSEQEILTIKTGEGIIGRVAKEGKTIIATGIELRTSILASENEYSALLAVPLLDGEREILGVLSVSSDENKVFNEQQKRFLEALANHAVIAIKNSKSQRKMAAVESLVSLGDLASNLIHQTGGELAGIKEATKHIRNTDLSEKEIKELAKSLYKSASSLYVKIEKLESLEPDKFKVLFLLDVVSLGLNEFEIPAHTSVSFDIESFRGLPSVLAPEQQLVFAFSNLISNSLEAMPNGGELTIRANRIKNSNREFVEIEIQDTGRGIPQKDIKKIFEKKYTSKERGGFGLWWTKILIEDRLDGCLSVASVEGRGTCMIIRLPAYLTRETLHVF